MSTASLLGESQGAEMCAVGSRRSCMEEYLDGVYGGVRAGGSVRKKGEKV